MKQNDNYPDYICLCEARPKFCKHVRNYIRLYGILAKENEKMKHISMDFILW